MQANLTVGERVKILREQAGLSATELSRRSGVDTSQVIRIEAGRCRPKEDTILRLAHGLGVPVSMLLGENRESEDIESGFLVAQFRKLTPPARRAVLRYVQDVEQLFPQADEVQQLPLLGVA